MDGEPIKLCREVKLSRTICIANQKGGVGKTTTAINLATGLSRSGAATLLIDLDPQCNATSGMGIKPTVRHALLQNTTLSESAIETYTGNLRLLPGSRSFQDVDKLATESQTKSEHVVQQIQGASEQFDFVIVDCPPSLGSLTKTALTASTEVLMPIQCEYFAMEGLTQMIEVIRDTMNAQPGKLQFGGILLTMFDNELELTHEVNQQVKDFFGEIVFDTVIPRDVAVTESSSHGVSVLDYSPRSRGTRAYIELCTEVMERD